MLVTNILSALIYTVAVHWVIKTYRSQSGKEVVSDFIFGLQPATKAKLLGLLDLLEEFGPDLGMPHSRNMGGGVYELRVKAKQETRLFYTFATDSTIYLLHGFVKKTQQTPKRELTTAIQRRTNTIQS